MSSKIHDYLVAHNAQLVNAMMASTKTQDAAPDDDRRQFIVGFVYLVTEAAGGNTTPRDEYLDAVLPGLKASGMPLTVIMTGMVQVAMSLAASVDADYVPWCVSFCGDYTARLLKVWSA